MLTHQKDHTTLLLVTISHKASQAITPKGWTWYGSQRNIWVQNNHNKPEYHVTILNRLASRFRRESIWMIGKIRYTSSRENESQTRR